MGKSNSDLTELAMVGWINATLAYDGLLAAGPNFDRAKVIAATNAMKAFTADGLLPAIDWSQAHIPYTEKTRTKVTDTECGVYVKVVDGKFQSATDKDKPWLCWKSNDQTWTKPTPENFD
jgi:hypothetical protein